MQRIFPIMIALVLLGCDRSANSDGTAPPAASEDGISVYFSPGTDCSQLIIDKVRMAQKHVYVQAYSFSSERIAKALNEGHKRGVEVKVILSALAMRSELNEYACTYTRSEEHTTA